MNASRPEMPRVGKTTKSTKIRPLAMRKRHRSGCRCMCSGGEMGEVTNLQGCNRFWVRDGVESYNWDIKSKLSKDIRTMSQCQS